jgi:hypothetical protein
MGFYGMRDMLVEGTTDGRGYTEVVYITNRHRTTYTSKDILDIVGIDVAIKYGLVSVNQTAFKTYLKQHPEISLPSRNEYTKPFLGTKNL